jgi:uncharacterized protein (DUF305 family)
MTLRLASPLLVSALAGCAAGAPPANTPPAETGPAGGGTAGVMVSAPVNPADVRFMTDMIGHHAQALVMARWAPTHGASDAVKILAERIIVGQNDEIRLMQRWLRERGQPVPAVDAPMDHAAHGTGHAGMMPGMLTPDQLAQLDQARGPVFDWMFLNYMIQHHRGAVTMVDALFGSQGAAQDEPVFKIASGVYADQTTEIERMQKMLDALPAEGPHE